MKVTKGQPKQETRKVIAFYTGSNLVFRDRDSDENFALDNRNTVYKGYANFDEYLSDYQNLPGFITFYEGDTIIIEL